MLASSGSMLELPRIIVLQPTNSFSLKTYTIWQFFSFFGFHIYTGLTNETLFHMSIFGRVKRGNPFSMYFLFFLIPTCSMLFKNIFINLFPKYIFRPNDEDRGFISRCFPKRILFVSFSLATSAVRFEIFEVFIAGFKNIIPFMMIKIIRG